MASTATYVGQLKLFFVEFKSSEFQQGKLLADLISTAQSVFTKATYAFSRKIFADAMMGIMFTKEQIKLMDTDMWDRNIHTVLDEATKKKRNALRKRRQRYLATLDNIEKYIFSNDEQDEVLL
jgi:hypothetical protein